MFQRNSDSKFISWYFLMKRAQHSFIAYTLCISNSFTSVSYQIAGSTFLRSKKNISMESLCFTTSQQTLNISLPTCKYETMLQFHYQLDIFGSKLDEELAVGLLKYHVVKISKSLIRPLNPYKRLANDIYEQKIFRRD